MIKHSFINRFCFLLFSSSMCLFLLLMSIMNSTMLIEFNLFNLSSVMSPILIILDKTSVSFSFVVTLISSCVFSFASKYMMEDPYYNRFIIILLSFVISMNFLIFSGSILLLFVGWDGLGITSFALIIYYQNKESLSAGYLTLIVNRIGDTILVFGVCFLVLFGQFSILPLLEQMQTLMFVFVLASLTKSAQYPFSPWLPAAMAAPTPVSALVHSSTLVTAGVYLVIRLSMASSIMYDSAMVLSFCGSITCLIGGLAAINEMDLKKLIALSTLSQLGLMMFSLSMGNPFMALFHLYTHAMFKALLFLVAGVILMMSFGCQDMRLLGGILIKSPILIIFQNISSLCLMGAPFVSAFYSKHMILEMMLTSSLNLFSVMVMLLATMCTCIYVIRSLKILCWGNLVININSSFSTKDYFLPLMILSLMSILSGKFMFLYTHELVLFFYLPSLAHYGLNIIIIFAVIMGLSLKLMFKSYSLSTLYFLSPSLKMMGKPCSKVLKGMSNLDYGWLEPKYLMYPSFYKFINNINNLLLWPKLNMYTIMRGFLAFMYVTMMCYTIYQ
uniref:NADH-ubiquinone oxidoreductase chain 5 n=1 Tax=Ryssota otaheitana TaxID=2595071 RepID=A0A5B8G1N5_9EUPU|nr:NADH dehydrogenase subunit 5 [Ryssota otaheitana]QDM39454.1 NADH dehydrogenase subunit 5 [Ryssota otaheitana]